MRGTFPRNTRELGRQGEGWQARRPVKDREKNRDAAGAWWASLADFIEQYARARLYAVRKNYLSSTVKRILLTFLSNIVAYACRPSSTKDRHDVHRHRLFNRRGTIGGCREYDAPGLPSACARPSAAETGRTWRKPFWGPYSGAKVFLRAGIGGLPVGDWQNACGNCGNPHDEPHQGFASALGNLGNLANPHSAASRRTSGAALAGEACPDGCNNERRKGRKGRKPIFGPL
jgi:hypothetical protein